MKVLSILENGQKVVYVEIVLLRLERKVSSLDLSMLVALRTIEKKAKEFIVIQTEMNMMGSGRTVIFMAKELLNGLTGINTLVISKKVRCMDTDQ